MLQGKAELRMLQLLQGGQRGTTPTLRDPQNEMGSGFRVQTKSFQIPAQKF